MLVASRSAPTDRCGASRRCLRPVKSIRRSSHHSKVKYGRRRRSNQSQQVPSFGVQRAREVARRVIFFVAEGTLTLACLCDSHRPELCVRLHHRPRISWQKTSLRRRPPFASASGTRLDRFFRASIVIARDLPCFFSLRWTNCLAGSHSRSISGTISKKAHFKCGLPILAPPPPVRLPSLVCCGVTRRA